MSELDFLNSKSFPLRCDERINNDLLNFAGLKPNFQFRISRLFIWRGVTFTLRSSGNIDHQISVVFQCELDFHSLTVALLSLFSPATDRS